MKICGLLKTTLLDYPGHVAAAVFTGGCNFRCPFCHNSEILDMFSNEQYTEDEILDFLKSRGHKLEGVCISGGEPTIHGDLPAFIKRIKFETELKVKLDTNGTNPDMLTKLINEGLIDYVAMDIKSGLSGYSEAAGIREGSELIKRVIKTKDILMSGKLPYEFRTTYVDGIHSESDFEEIGSMIKGTDRYFVQAFKDGDNVLCRDRGYKTPPKEKLIRASKIVGKYVKHSAVRGVDT